MLTDEIKKYVNDSVLCWLATVSEEGVPNVSPKEIFTFSGDDTMLIANIASPQSIRNISKNENVCVSFIEVFVQKGFQLKGKATIIKRTDSDFKEVVRPLAELAGDQFPIASVISILVSSVKPIIAPKYILYPKTTEEEQLASALQTYKVQAIS